MKNINHQERDILHFYLNQYIVNMRNLANLDVLISFFDNYEGNILKKIKNKLRYALDSIGTSFRVESDLLKAEKLFYNTLSEYLKSYKYGSDINSYSDIKKCEIIEHTFQLSKHESAIFKLLYLSYKYQELGLLIEVTKSKTQANLINLLDVFSCITSVSIINLRKILSPYSSLIKKGVLKLENNVPSLTELIKSIIVSKFKSVNDIRKILYKKSTRGDLSSSNFSYMKDEYQHISSLIKNALDKNEIGVNILIYGKPCTGKTQLSKSIATNVNAVLYFIGESDQDKIDNELSKLDEIKSANYLIDSKDRSILVVDEAEDPYTSNSFFYSLYSTNKERTDKLMLNSVLENNKIPTIWICNDIRGIDDSHIRRFDYILRMEELSKNIKISIWKKIINKSGINMSDDEIAQLIKRYDFSPSFIKTAIKSVKLTGDRSAFERTLDAFNKTINGRSTNKDIKENDNEVIKTQFSYDILNTDIDIKNLATKLINSNQKQFSLCLYGASGTGKSEFARHLANELGLKIVFRRASDIIDQYLGASEKNIAKAFAEARREKALLIFDEADSFLTDRVYARRSWEISIVNEMLTQMENHKYPFICTTNLMDNLDKAALRRFTFKVKYNYMTLEQVKSAFMLFFGKSVNLKGYELKVSYLTPGDFLTVQKKSSILCITDSSQILQMLIDEQNTKGVKISAKIGYNNSVL